MPKSNNDFKAVNYLPETVKNRWQIDIALINLNHIFTLKLSYSTSIPKYIS